MAEDNRDLINLVLKDGTVVIETRPDLAPKHVTQIKKLISEEQYDGDYTINLTSYGNYNVWISESNENGFWVETNAEKEWSFDWSAIGKRTDAKLEVEPDA